MRSAAASARRADRHQVGARTGGSAAKPGQSPSPERMPHVQSSANGAAAPPVVMRTSTSGAPAGRSARRGISQRMAKVGPTPTREHLALAGRGDLTGQPRERVEQRRQPGTDRRAPAGGGREAVGVRSNSGTPSRSSSSRTSRLTAAAMTLSSAAAAAKEPVRAAASKARMPLREAGGDDASIRKNLWLSVR